MRILVVDDDPLAGELTAAVLEDLGHEVTLATDALDAMARLAEEDGIALILSDLNMPLINGIELFRELRAQGSTRPFILLTGDDPEGPARIEPALDACLMKDFTLDESLPQVLATVAARHGLTP